MRLHYFDYFRGIAVLLIVAGHAGSSWTVDTIPEMVIFNLITGGSTLFVFISGFFFHYLFYPKFQYLDFMVKKSKSVLLPYLILSISAFFLIVVYLDHPYFRFSQNLINAHDYLLLLLQYLWTGRIFINFWFIPFIMIVFLLSPVFIWYIKLPLKIQLYMLVLLSFTSMLIQRPGDNLSPIHSLVYYTPTYLLGIIFSIHKEKILIFINNKCIILGLLTILASVIQILLYGEFGSSYKEVSPIYHGINVNAMFSYNGFDIIFIQKILMIFFILSLLQKEKLKDIKPLKYFASVSFAIFFIHTWVRFLLQYLSIIDSISFLPGFIIFVIEFLLTVGISLIIAMLFKYLLHEKSKYIIGW